MRLIRLIVVSTIVCCVTSQLSAQYFREDWSDGNDQDGLPVSWQQVVGTFQILGDDYVAMVADPSTANARAAAIALGRTFENIAIEIHGSVDVDGAFFAIRGDGDVGYAGGIDENGWLGIHRLLAGPETTGINVQGNLTTVTALDDIRLEFQLVGEELGVRTWPADGVRPFSAQLSATDDHHSEGNVGLAYVEFDGGGRGVMHSLEVYEPKNFVGNRNAIGLSEILDERLPNDLPVVFDISEDGVDQLSRRSGSLDLNDATIEINALGGLPAFGEYQLIDVETITGNASIVMSNELQTNLLVDRLLTEGILEIQGDVFPDCNGDGMFDVFDLNCFDASQTDDLLNRLGLIRGDADGNGTVEFADFTKLANQFGQRGQYTDGDFNKDGMVLFADFLILSNHFGQGASEIASVPEGSSSLLLLSALILLVRRPRQS